MAGPPPPTCGIWVVWRRLARETNIVKRGVAPHGNAPGTHPSKVCATPSAKFRVDAMFTQWWEIGTQDSSRRESDIVYRIHVFEKTNAMLNRGLQAAGGCTEEPPASTPTRTPATARGGGGAVGMTIKLDFPKGS
eukprot:4321131-Prymnesium_polylepis.1